MTTKSATAGYKTSPKIKIVLVISLAINLLIAGMVGGMMYRANGVPHMDPHVRDAGFKVLVNALTRKDRFMMGRALREEFGNRDARLPAARLKINELVKVLEASEFDGDKVETILRSNALNIIPRQEAGLRMLTDRLKSMTAKERQTYVDRLDMAMSMGMGDARRKQP